MLGSTLKRVNYYYYYYYYYNFYIRWQVVLFSTLKRVNCFLASGPIVHEMNVHWESPQLSCARNASSPATC